MIIIINFYLRNNEEIIEKNDIPYIIRKGIYFFDIDNDKYELDLSKMILIKDNSESKLEFIFNNKKETNGTYYIKELDFYMDARVKTNKLIYKDNKLEIYYELYLQDEYIGNFELKIEVKE